MLGAGAFPAVGSKPTASRTEAAEVARETVSDMGRLPTYFCPLEAAK